MRRYQKLFAFFFASTFLLASVVYGVLHLLMPDGYVFGVYYRMFCYHYEHPLQYIALVAVIYALIATSCAMMFRSLSGWKLFSVILAIMLSSVFIASVPGGVLWSIHDMQAGYFPTGARFWRALWWGAVTGLQMGWLIIALSIPYNVIGLVIGFFVTRHGFRIAGAINSYSQPLPAARPALADLYR